VPWCLEGLAGLAAAHGDFVRTGRLCGARDALRERLSFPLPIAYPLGYAATQAVARAALGDDAFAAACEDGKTLPHDQAIADAVEQLRLLADTAPSDTVSE